MTCEYCKSQNDGTVGSGRFCSLSCARGFSSLKNRVERNNKIRAKLKGPSYYCKSCNSLLRKQRLHAMCKTCLHQSDEFSKRVSDSCKKSTITGGYRESSGRGKKSWYTSPFAGRVHLQSTYELKYAQYLDSLGVNWVRNTSRFEYEYLGKKHHYIPDFYLPDSDKYIEIKGYSTAQDIEKWKSVKNLEVLFKHDLLQLGLLV